MTILLSGIVGSTAYGLATADSDIDRLGIFIAPTEEFLGLSKPTETVVRTKPDVTLHEVGKWFSLALKGNPTVMEVVWLPKKCYDVITPYGIDLISMRESFLHAKGVRNAYLGYAQQQFERLVYRGDGSFSADTRKRTAKHARHLKRLLAQGLELYTTGVLTIEVENPEEYHAFGAAVAAGDYFLADDLLRATEEQFNTRTTCLPEAPNYAQAEDYLIWLRKEFL